MKVKNLDFLSDIRLTKRYSCDLNSEREIMDRCQQETDFFKCKYPQNHVEHKKNMNYRHNKYCYTF